MGKILLVISILLTVIIGVGLSNYAAPGHQNLLGNVRLTSTAEAHEQGKKVALNDWSLFGNGMEEEKNTKAAAEEPKQEAVDEDASESEPEELDTNAVWKDAPGTDSPMAKGTKDELGRGIEVTKIYHGLVKTYGFTTPDAEVLGLGSAENPGRPIPLGATRGEPCRESSKGAAGSFQVVPGTAGPIWAKIRKDPNEAYNPQNIEHNMAVAVAHLEGLKKKYGEDRFRAYNGGTKVKNGLPRYDWPEVRETTIRYDRYVRSHIPTYQAALDGKVDFAATEPTAMAANISTPVPIGKCWISSIFGEGREYRGKGATHMGMDFACEVGIPVYAIADGIVAFAGEHTGSDSGKRAGIQVQLTHGNHAIGKLGGSRYFHLASANVNTGDRVKAGQQVGTVGLTGVHFSGSHLHFESYIWSADSKLVVCQTPGVWFRTLPFAPNFPAQYQGPKTPAAAAAGKKFDRIWEARKKT